MKEIIIIITLLFTIYALVRFFINMRKFKNPNNLTGFYYYKKTINRSVIMVAFKDSNSKIKYKIATRDDIIYLKSINKL